MKSAVTIDNWIISEDLKPFIELKKETIIINNTTNKEIEINYGKILTAPSENIEYLYINFFGKAKNSGGYLLINEDHEMPLNSEISMPINTNEEIKLSLKVAANSSISFHDFDLEFKQKINLIDNLDEKNDVLIITPQYPSYTNLYACAFAHSRNKEYIKSGIKAQVFVVNERIWYQTKYEKDGVPVLKGSYKDLKELLSKHQYKVIITHFVDEKLYPIFDGNIFNNQKLIFICHGPETVYRYLVNKTRHYFTAPYKEPFESEIFDLKDYYVKKYARKENVEWVFVSEWLKNFSEQQLNIEFLNSHVINNIINEELFPYFEKNAEDRKKILVVRKFDNICQHSIDQVVLAILELSRRDFFDDLEFDIYGDGNYYNELIEPIKSFKNIHFYKRFVPNEQLKEIYKLHGIMLLPSRHDAHAVAMGESAASGLVVVGSNVTSNPYFMNEKENHTLADPEDYKSLADIIERLYKNPKEFLKISKNMADFTKQFNKENTVAREIELINKSLKDIKDKETIIITKKAEKKPVLTIAVPAYNVEKYIEKCLFSIINGYNAEKMEVLVINDGSTDNTAEIVKKYEKLSNGIVRLINKENGGHGSTINRAIQEAKGEYFRLIDGDDWVDSTNLSRLIDILENEKSDIVLTKGSYDYIEEAKLVDIIKYDNLVEGHQYNFEDLTYENYGFKTYGPLLTTGNYRTEILKKANFKISEKKPYVDMEFNAFSLKYANTIIYYNLDIYRYLIGREGQTVSRDYWKKKYQDHEYIIFNILNKVLNDSEYSERKKVYILKNIIAQMVDSQIFMFDAICKWNELDEFLVKLKKYEEAYNYSMNYIKEKNGNCWLILNVYKKKINNNSNESIIIPGLRETMDDIAAFSTKRLFKKAIKAIVPYGLIVLRRRRQAK